MKTELIVGSVISIFEISLLPDISWKALRARLLWNCSVAGIVFWESALVRSSRCPITLKLHVRGEKCRRYHGKSALLLSWIFLADRWTTIEVQLKHKVAADPTLSSAAPSQFSLIELGDNPSLQFHRRPWFFPHLVGIPWLMLPSLAVVSRVCRWHPHVVYVPSHLDRLPLKVSSPRNWGPTPF